MVFGFITIYTRQKNLLYWTFARLIRYSSHKHLSFSICFSNIGYQIKDSLSYLKYYLTWIYFWFQSLHSNLVWLNVALVSAGLGIKHHLPTKPSSLFLCNSYKSWYSDIKLKDGTKNKSHWFTFELLRALKSSLTNESASWIEKKAVWPSGQHDRPPATTAMAVKTSLWACLHGGGGSQEGEVTHLGGVTRLSK